MQDNHIQDKNYIKGLGAYSAGFAAIFAISAQALMNFHPETIPCMKYPGTVYCENAQSTRAGGVKVFGAFAGISGLASGALAIGMLMERRRITRIPRPDEP